MIWILPEDGEKIKIKRFAFFPVQVGNKIVWFETYTEIRRYSSISSCWFVDEKIKEDK